MSPKSQSRDTKRMAKDAFKAEKQQEKEERAALVVKHDTKPGQHNCPLKDAGTTHPFRARCFHQKHAGFCPACGGIYSYKHGCHQHGYNKEDLLLKAPTEDEKRAFRIANGLEEPTEAKEDEEDEQQEEAAENQRRNRGRRGQGRR